MLVALDKFGRMVLPKAMRNAMGLKPGDQFEAVGEADRIILRPLHGEPPVRSQGGVLVFAGRCEGELDKAVADLRDERLKGLANWERQR